MAVRINSEAPNFSANTTQGRINFHEWIGDGWAILFSHPKDFTPGCTTEAAEFTRDYDKFVKAGIEIVGISPDSEESHDKFRAKMGIPYPLVADTEKEVSKNYGVYGMKTFMGREFMGVIRMTFLIDRAGKVIRVFPKVKPAGHSKEVLESFI